MPDAPPSPDWLAVAVALRQAGLEPQTDVPLAKWTTFRLGGNAPLFVDCPDADSLCKAAAILHQRDCPWFLLGGGSNLLVSDDGPGVAVLRFCRPSAQIRRSLDTIEVSGGTSLDAVASYCCRAGLGNFVNASGIPGTIGGAIVGNAGAFGWQVADALTEVELLTLDGSRRRIPRADLHFAYRDSELKSSGAIVLAASFTLPAEDAAALAVERERILALRRDKHPDLATWACAGSFFRNIEPTSAADRRQAAGWFLEQAGAKAMTVGGAAVFPRHANIPIKAADACRAADVHQLTTQMAAAVRADFGIELVREVLLVGPFKGESP